MTRASTGSVFGLGESTVALAVRARVAADLTGDDEVTLVHRDAAGRPVPVRLNAAPTTWRELAEETGRRVVASLAGPVALTATAASAPEVVAAAGHWQLAEPTGLDPVRARRLLGYHERAWDLAHAHPDDDHRERSLLGAEELALQLDGLGGPVRPLPDLRVHQLIEERCRRQPDDVAAVHGSATLTYGELDARANRIAHALLARGLRAEDVVAVVTERNLTWLVCVLAVLKSGGAYLPVEPHFPPARVAGSLGRAGCRFVLTEVGSAAVLDTALAELAGVQRLDADDLAADQTVPDHRPEVEVGADQLAYIYFTSGSTGQPKGAMCEQAGMLNHILAKIEDLEIESGAVVAEVAPQCFDISLWQLLAGLVVGGRTLIVEQDVVLDPAAMLDRLVGGRVAVLQVVPSYLEVLLTHLEQQPVALPDLRVVSVTGEAVKRELVARFFEAAPMAGVSLVNAYGLTETSDDTNHAVMRALPPGDQVPLGRPVRNVTVYVVDDKLRPVPLGAPGEIVFSGICVGRGYVNDPERTAAAFGLDPHRPGARLYRSGDIGRWGSDGELEFLGRRDSQLKVSGFRIELGEIENALLGVRGVRDGAVVPVTPTGAGTHLVGFYVGAGVGPDAVRSHLAESLPHYMVPTVLHPRERLPLSDNGKIDRRALTELGLELGAEAASDVQDAPLSAAELRVAQVWAQVLGVPVASLGPEDRFTDRGGTSLSAVKVLLALDRTLSLREVAGAPRLADLAQLLETRSTVTTDRQLTS